MEVIHAPTGACPIAALQPAVRYDPLLTAFGHEPVGAPTLLDGGHAWAVAKGPFRVEAVRKPSEFLQTIAQSEIFRDFVASKRSEGSKKRTK